MDHLEWVSSKRRDTVSFTKPPFVVAKPKDARGTNEVFEESSDVLDKLASTKEEQLTP